MGVGEIRKSHTGAEERPWGRLPQRSAHKAKYAVGSVLEDDEALMLVVGCPRVRAPASLWLAVTDRRLLLVDAAKQATFTAAIGAISTDEGSWSRLRVQAPDGEVVCPLASNEDRDAVQDAWRSARDGASLPSADPDEPTAGQVPDPTPAEPTVAMDTSAHAQSAEQRRPLTRMERVASSTWWFHTQVWLGVALIGGLLAYAGAVGLESATIIIEGVPFLHTPIVERPMADTAVETAAVLIGTLLLFTGLGGARQAYRSRIEEAEALDLATRPVRPTPFATAEERQHVPLMIGTLGWVGGWIAWAVRTTDLSAWRASASGLAVGVILLLVSAAVVRPGNAGLQLKSLLVTAAAVSGLAALVDLFLP
jgi:hypothetical protein